MAQANWNGFEYVGAGWSGLEYGEFAVKVFEAGMVPLGLYRKPEGSDTNPLRYVYTSPDPATLLRKDDKIYAITSQEDSDTDQGLSLFRH